MINILNYAILDNYKLFSFHRPAACMIDEYVPCEDILSQINAAKFALHKAGQVVLKGHIQHCVRYSIEHGDADKTIANFTKAVEHFANMH